MKSAPRHISWSISRAAHAFCTLLTMTITRFFLFQTYHLYLSCFYFITIFLYYNYFRFFLYIYISVTVLGSFIIHNLNSQNSIQNTTILYSAIFCFDLKAFLIIYKYRFPKNISFSLFSLLVKMNVQGGIRLISSPVHLKKSALSFLNFFPL